MAMVRPVVPVIEYVINQDYIAEFLCINTDKPELDCNGKCYLMQMLQQQEDEKKQNLPQINLGEYPIGFVDIVVIPIKKDFETYLAPYFGNKDNYSYMYGFSDFHPPALPI
jgi:hypothetical protein